MLVSMSARFHHAHRLDTRLDNEATDRPVQDGEVGALEGRMTIVRKLTGSVIYGFPSHSVAAGADKHDNHDNSYSTTL
jgi:hypothetical protein